MCLVEGQCIIIILGTYVYTILINENILFQVNCYDLDLLCGISIMYWQTSIILYYLTRNKIR